jgi:probable F420-dependent oxidoreductase
VKFGVAALCTDESLDPQTLGRVTEESGLFDSLFYGEHTHIPASRESPFPDGELPRDHHRTLDPFVALAATACATNELLLGTAVCLLVARDPIICAKEVASLDHISGGRVLLGVSGGWNLEEMRNHGTDPRTRFALQRERVEAMRVLWTQEEATYHGRFVHFDRIWSWPKPAQRPHPPVLVGGLGPTVIDRVLAFGDAWFPNHRPGLLDRVAELRGRADRPIGVSVMAVPADPAVIEAYEKAGIDRVCHWLPSQQRGPVERELDRWESAVADVHAE